MISQPMQNKTNEQIRKEREETIKKFEELHINVIDSIIEETANPKKYNEYHPALFYLAKSIDFMAQVDAVYFMDGWKDARGCRIEHKICEEYGIKILYSNFFISNSDIFTTKSPLDIDRIRITPCKTTQIPNEYNVTCNKSDDVDTLNTLDPFDPFIKSKDYKEWQSGNHIPRID